MHSQLIENLAIIDADYDPFDDDFLGVIDADYDPFDDCDYDVDVNNSDDYQYSEADVLAALESCRLIPESGVREMLARGETVKSIIAADRASWNDYQNDIKTANRDFKERWEQTTDGYDIVDVAHAAGVALSDFDKIAKLLGYGKNWSEGAERRRAYKEKKTARRAKAQEYAKAEKFVPASDNDNNNTQPAPRKSTLIVTPEIKEVITPRPAKVLLSPPRKIKVKKLVTIDNLAAMEKRLLKVPSNRARPGNPRIWCKAGAVRW